MGISPFTSVIPTQAVELTDATLYTFPSSKGYGIYVGGLGNVDVTLRDDPSTTVTFTAVPVGTVLWGRFLTVQATTTATNLVALLATTSHQI